MYQSRYLYGLLDTEKCLEFITLSTYLSHLLITFSSFSYQIYHMFILVRSERNIKKRKEPSKRNNDNRHKTISEGHTTNNRSSISAVHYRHVNPTHNSGQQRSRGWKYVSRFDLRERRRSICQLFGKLTRNG